MDKTMLYIAGCETIENGGGIYCFDITGSEPVLLDVAAADMPMYMDIEGSIMHVLLMHPFPDSTNSGLLDFAILPDGRISPAGKIADTGGIEACHLCHFAGNEYAANYMSGSIFSTSGGFVTHTGAGINPDRQESAHTHFIFPSPDGKYLLCCDLGTDTIFTYDSQLCEVSRAHVPQGHGCRHLAYSEDGTTVFCANELMSTVTVFAYSSGVLEEIETVPSIPVRNPLNTSAAIRFDGSRVYVSQRGEDAISVMDWDGSHLRLSGMYPVSGASPRDFIIHGSTIICANQQSGTVTFLPLEGGKIGKAKHEVKVSGALAALIELGVRS